MLYWIWLTQISGIGPISQKVLLERFKQPNNIYHASFEELFECSVLGKSKITKILAARSLENAKRIQDNAFNTIGEC